jgi:hypothetical protein
MSFDLPLLGDFCSGIGVLENRTVQAASKCFCQNNENGSKHKRVATQPGPTDGHSNSESLPSYFTAPDDL